MVCRLPGGKLVRKGGKVLLISKHLYTQRQQLVELSTPLYGVILALERGEIKLSRRVKLFFLFVVFICRRWRRRREKLAPSKAKVRCRVVWKKENWLRTIDNLVSPTHSLISPRVRCVSLFVWRYGRSGNLFFRNVILWQTWQQQKMLEFKVNVNRDEKCDRRKFQFQFLFPSLLYDENFKIIFAATYGLFFIQVEVSSKMCLFHSHSQDMLLRCLIDFIHIIRCCSLFWIIFLFQSSPMQATVSRRENVSFFSVTLQSDDESCTTSSNSTIFRERRQSDRELSAKFHCLIFTLCIYTPLCTSWRTHGEMRVGAAEGKGRGSRLCGVKRREKRDQDLVKKHAWRA